MPKKIMIVDDSASIRETLLFVLKKSEYDVVEACDGVDALNKLANNKVNLIVCDVNMPNMDGITFVKKLKSEAAYSEHKFTPVIMLTTESGEDMKIEGKAAGVKAWMIKPFPPEKLLEAIKMLLG